VRERRARVDHIGAIVLLLAAALRKRVMSTSLARKKPRSDDRDNDIDESNPRSKLLLTAVTWLREHHPKNVMIPCALGEKRPMFPYRDDAWSWESFDALNLDSDKLDWAIVLQDLCVVDVDSAELAAKLEKQFPVLLEVPCERTSRGFHYFFQRSHTADALNYFDGCAQVLEDVDFKTLTRFGTGGVIVVAPSTGKEWQRPLWEYALQPIPDAVLFAVARPTTMTTAPAPITNSFRPPPAESDLENATETVTETVAAASKPEIEDEIDSNEEVECTFDEDDALRVSGSRLAFLNSMEFCAAKLSGRWSMLVDESGGKPPLPTVHLPCRRWVLEGLFSMNESGDFVSEEMGHVPSSRVIAKIEEAADMLGAPKRTKNLLLERATFWADLYRHSPVLYRMSRNEQAAMLGTCAATSDLGLLTLTHGLAQCIGYEPPTKDSDLWLFRHLPTIEGNGDDKVDLKDIKVFMDHPQDVLLSQLPEPVVAILKRHTSSVVVAGGAVLGGITRFANHGSDVDLFVYGLDQAGSQEVLRSVALIMEQDYKGQYTLSESPAAVTYTKKDRSDPPSEAPLNDRIAHRQRNRPFQIVLGMHRARSQILEYFDLAPTKCLARIAEDGSSLTVEMLGSCLHAIKTMSFHVDLMYWSAASVARITKYVAKGFEVFVPGVRRAAFKADPATREIQQYGLRHNVLSTLFDAEAEVLRSREYWSRSNQELERSGELVFGNELIIQKITGRLEEAEAATIASKVANKLGVGYDASLDRNRPRPPAYDDFHEEYGFYDIYGGSTSKASTNSYGFIRESFRCDVAIRLGDARRNIPINTVFWTFTEAGRFKPSAAHLEDLYDLAKLDKVAEEEAAARSEALLHESASDIDGDIDGDIDASSDEDEDDDDENHADDEDEDDVVDMLDAAPVVFALTAKEVKAMTVPKLKEALEARGLDQTGLKATLAARLLATVEA
jgi:hypothetical protein